MLFTEHTFSRPFSRKSPWGGPRPAVSARSTGMLDVNWSCQDNACLPTSLCRDAPSLPVLQGLRAVALRVFTLPGTCERADWKPPSCWVAPSDPWLSRWTDPPLGTDTRCVTRSTHLMQRLSRYLSLGTEALAGFPSELEILVYAFHGLVEVLISFTRLQIHGAELIRSNANICFLCNQEACVNILSVECLQVLLENSV